jgi:hypothetical protein
VTISREQVVNRIGDAGFKYHSETKRVELYRKKGTQDYVVVPRHDRLPETAVRIILRQAGLTPTQIDEFIAGAVK